MSKYYGHSGNHREEWQTLVDHSRGVAHRVKEALQGWSGQAEGEFAALAHDLGKYPDSFQDRLRGIGSGYDHWSAGTHFSITQNLIASAFAVYGHHVGLPAMSQLREKSALSHFGVNHPQGLTLTTDDPHLIQSRMLEDGLELPKVSAPIVSPATRQNSGEIETMLEIRRLFSALTDSDFLDTEEHMQGVARTSGRSLETNVLLPRLNAYLESLRAASTASATLREIREHVLSDAREAARKPPGLFTLTAPTGAGKTLAMLAFALEHAKQHNLRRVITVLPFLTLIEQTVRVYRDVLQVDSQELLEHHSLSGSAYDQEEENARRLRALTENWDAPLIVTTSVQFLESLFGDKPSMCRKLHRIAGSVILLDEVQTIPVNLVKYTLAALTCLTKKWGCSILMATATQPAFEHLSEKVQALKLPPWAPTPVVSDVANVFQKLLRTKYDFIPKETPLSDEELVERLATEHQVLVVVNLKRQARSLFETLKAHGSPVFHLSTRNCAEHRTKILAEARARLQSGKPVILVSTQCIEAGVDIDFPRAYRAYAPLDSIVQAGGRCNREGKEAFGLVTVYEPEGASLPPGAYTQATLKTKSKIAEWKAEDPDFCDPTNPELVREYFQSLYAIGKLHKDELDLALKDFDFPAIRANYRLIEGDTISIVVPYAGNPGLFQSLKMEAEEFGISRSWMSRARPITVSEFRPKLRHPIHAYLQPLKFRPRRGGTSSEVPDWFIYLEPSHYHSELGLVPPEDMPEFVI